MPFSTACSTPLSNFEAGLNYKDVNDPAVMVAFPLEDDADGASLVAWTTTPWTLPSNLGLCVNPEFTYVKVCRVAGRVDGWHWCRWTWLIVAQRLGLLCTWLLLVWHMQWRLR